VILAAVGEHYGWPRADLEALTAADLVFYAGAMAALLDLRAKARER